MSIELVGHIENGLGYAKKRLQKCIPVLEKYGIKFPPFYLGTLNIKLTGKFPTPNWLNIIHIPCYQLDEANPLFKDNEETQKFRECWELIPIESINGRKVRGYVYRTTTNYHGDTFIELITEDLRKNIVSAQGSEIRLLISDDEEEKKRKSSFIVCLWAELFDVLKWISLFRPVHRIFRAYWIVDFYVLINLISSIILLFLFPFLSSYWWWFIILIYTGIRIVEIIIYQINVLLFDQYRENKKGKRYILRGYRRVVLLLLHNYIEILFWFALLYRNYNSCFVINPLNKVSIDSFCGALYFSVVTMATLGYGDITPSITWGEFLVISQTTIGIFMTISVIARFISLLPKPETMDEFERVGQ